MAVWKTLSTEVAYKTPWIELIHDSVLNHGGKQLDYTYLHLPNPPVTVLAINKRGEILLQQNYRHPLKQTLWELPSGHSDGQDLLTAAKRELLEEAGLESDDWSSLGDIYLAPGVANIRQCLFLARDVRPVTEARDEDEDISNQQFVPLKKVKAMLTNNDITDADSLIALYRYFMGGTSDV